MPLFVNKEISLLDKPFSLDLLFVFLSVLVNPTEASPKNTGTYASERSKLRDITPAE